VVGSELGAFSVRVDASDDLRALGSFDAVLLTFKAHQWNELLPQLAPLKERATPIVTLQNGLPFWFVRRPPVDAVDPGGRIGACFSDELAIGGVVHASGHVARPGVIHQSRGMHYRLGESAGGPSKRVERIVAAMRAAGLDAREDAAIRESVWLKLIDNAGLNPVSALHRASVHELLAAPALRAQARALMQEAAEVGRALGVLRSLDLDARLERAARLDDVRTSMLQDLEAGRPLELDPILGAVVELGGHSGVGVPRSADAYERLRALERTRDDERAHSH
jgi:2-dehydropantoate 2-reductase